MSWLGLGTRLVSFEISPDEDAVDLYAPSLGQLAAGCSIEEILADYPYLDRDDILAALEFAAAAVQERELPLAQPA